MDSKVKKIMALGVSEDVAREFCASAMPDGGDHTVAVNFYHVFRHTEGRAVLDYMRRVYHDTPSYVSGDPHETARNEGCRAVYLAIVNNIETGRKILDERKEPIT